MNSRKNLKTSRSHLSAVNAYTVVMFSEPLVHLRIHTERVFVDLYRNNSVRLRLKNRRVTAPPKS
jgi:hypothetical protein